jgi:hypothetical protein
MRAQETIDGAPPDDRQALLNQILRDRAPKIAADPRVRPTIRVGGIGRRHIDAGARDAVIDAIRGGLGQIRDTAEAALRHGRVHRLFDGPLDLVLVSPLAEGADRLIADTALELGYRLGAILPFDRAAYESTFDLEPEPPPVVHEFRRLVEVAASEQGYGLLVLDGDPGAGGRNLAYQNCAASLMRWSDILIAVVEEAQTTSQTAVSVEEAILMGVPVIVIDPSRAEPFRLVVGGDLVGVADSEKELRKLVIELLGGAGGAGGWDGDLPEHGRDAAHGLQASCEEDIKYLPERRCDFEYDGPFAAVTIAPVWVGWCAGLNGWIERRLRRVAAKADPDRPRIAAHTLPFDAASAASFVDVFLQYQRADAAANAYAELHRSVQIMIAVLAVLTGVFAVADIGTELPWFAGLQFLSLFCALLLVRVAGRERWLHRWLDYRLVAEVFRYAKFLLVAGRPSPFTDLRDHGGEDSARAWTRDYCQHVLRAQRVGMPGRGRVVVPHAVEAARTYIRANCFEDQLRYHRWSAAYREQLGRILQTSAVIVSTVTLAVVLANFGFKALSLAPSSPHLETLLNVAEFAAALLPAITAALLGLRAFGEHTVVARRSKSTVRTLLREEMRLAKAADIETLGRHTLAVARVLLRDIDGWLDLFADKHIES